ILFLGTALAFSSERFPYIYIGHPSTPHVNKKHRLLQDYKYQHHGSSTQTYHHIPPSSQHTQRLFSHTHTRKHMPLPNMFGRQTQFPKRSGSGYAWPESDSEDDIVIRPCATNEKADATVTMTECVPGPTAVEQASQPRPSLSGRRASAEDTNLQELWECMLELQQQYHCYNSTRMEIAADREDAMDMMPTKYCMDMLNDSIESLPEEGWKKLSKFLITDLEHAQKSQKWKFWKHL
ncbi:hypothetical protein CORC01_09728, partial [Colletotrichum orchidophilum]